MPLHKSIDFELGILSLELTHKRKVVIVKYTVPRTPKDRLKRPGGQEGLKEKTTGGHLEVKGNLRFPLDFTYHGCPQNLTGRALGNEAFLNLLEAKLMRAVKPRKPGRKRRPKDEK